MAGGVLHTPLVPGWAGHLSGYVPIRALASQRKPFTPMSEQFGSFMACGAIQYWM